MELLAIKLQSASDVVTNSSSELFAVKDGRTEKQIDALAVGHGDFHPARLFSLEEYRNCDDREADTYFDVVDGWFYDIDDPEDMAEYRADALVQHSDHYEKEQNLFEIDMFEWLAEATGEPFKGDYWWKYLDTYEEEVHDFLLWYDKEKEGKHFPSWWLPEEKERMQFLDGKVLLLSKDDNTVKGDPMEFAALLNATRYHLG